MASEFDQQSPDAKRRRTDGVFKLNEEQVNLAFENKWLSEWSKQFYLDNLSKDGGLSEKQVAIKEKIEKGVEECMKMKPTLDAAKVFNCSFGKIVSCRWG